MEKLTEKQNYIFMIIGVVIFIVGLGIGIVIGMNLNKVEEVSNNQEVIENNTNTQNEQNTTETKIASKPYVPKLSKEERLKTALSVTMAEEEFNQLKATVEKDETEYGDNYADFTSSAYSEAYKREPDRIYVKLPKIEGFYKFEKNDENYSHLLKVALDRISYSVMEDYNLYCFTPDSISTMMTSGDNYIIFDYDNIDLEKDDENYQKNLIFRYNQNTRLFRLATSLCYNEDLILVEELDRTEFATNTNISGYRYITEEVIGIDK